MIKIVASKFVFFTLGLPRIVKRLVVFTVDLGLCILTVWLAFYLRLGEFVMLAGNAKLALFVSIGLAIPVFVISGLYRAIFRYSDWPALLAVARAVGVYGLLYASVFTIFSISGVPRTIGIIQPILLLLFVCCCLLLLLFIVISFIVVILLFDIEVMYVQCSCQNSMKIVGFVFCIKNVTESVISTNIQV
jgi:FlaA1/EpsC-like NDP-sugar epimerase